MRASTAALLVASLIFILSAAVAAAAPVLVNVRVEGESRTLFEGPIWAEAQEVKATSDSSWRRCDGTGGRDSNLSPAPTPTSVTAGAMALIDQTFDARWYPGYEDYFVARWGPDSEEDGMSWGVLVNKALTSVGGCQYRLSEGDEVLWAYDAFEQKPLLELYPAQDTSSGAPPFLTTVRPGVPFEVEVLAYGDGQEGTPPAAPSRAGSTPFSGAQVAPVLTGANGYESVVDAGTPCGAETHEGCTATTDARGRATFVFSKPGWHRVKATWLAAGAGGRPREAAIRSNRLDVCVSETGIDGCPGGYPEDSPRTPPVVPAEPGSGLGDGQEGGQAGGARESESSPGSGGKSSTGSGGEAYGGQLESTVRYLQEAQNGDGGFGGEKGSPSDPDFSAWAALALAAAGINPHDQARPGDEDVFDYLAERADELTLTTDFARALLVVDAAGFSAEDFGGVDLVRQLLARQLIEGPDAGAFVHEGGDSSAAVNDTVFAILALSPLHEQAAQAAVARASAWLVAEQDADGGWPAACPRTTAGCSEGSEVDMTAAAVQALSAAGDRGDEAERRALAFLRAAQDANGGFPELPGRGEASNSASTAWSVQAIWASGEDPKTWLQAGGHEPLGFLASLQSANGSILWRAGEDVNPVWMTAYTLPAFAGVPLPIPPVAHAQALSQQGEGDGASSASGLWAEDARSRAGSVIAGGGGGGAALFSRPRPQSQGHSPGAKRLLARQPSRKPPSAGAAGSHGGASTPARVTGPRGDALTPAAGAADTGQGSGREVRGTLIGSAGRDASVRAAPGLRSAVAGAKTPWPALAIAFAALALAGIGSLLELRRPQVVL
ncbi:MAG TPA: prenyltransferase/squalene oxidase repeat-containing protein [Solirubrobacteraceae bacterium]|nr:prenyltransferase/squalene oxidase repeat-containing protein [Solirubrobacteraceae bacterium]